MILMIKIMKKKIKNRKDEFVIFPSTFSKNSFTKSYRWLKIDETSSTPTHCKNRYIQLLFRNTVVRNQCIGLRLRWLIVFRKGVLGPDRFFRFATMRESRGASFALFMERGRRNEYLWINEKSNGLVNKKNVHSTCGGVTTVRLNFVQISWCMTQKQKKKIQHSVWVSAWSLCCTTSSDAS